jgi:hypothetical protein
MLAGILCHQAIVRAADDPYVASSLNAAASRPPGIDWDRGIWHLADASDFLSAYVLPPPLDKDPDRFGGGEYAYNTPKGHWTNPPPFKPEALARYNKMRQEAFAGRDETFTGSCKPEGVPFSIQDYDKDILFKPGEIVIIPQFQPGDVRRIFMERKTHLQGDDLYPTFSGDSIGHWEGKTLVIDTIGLRTDTTIEIGMLHSAQLHVIERWTQTGPDAITIEETLIDPAIFTRPWTGIRHYTRKAGWITEQVCVDSESHTGEYQGHAQMFGPDGKPILPPTPKH